MTSRCPVCRNEGRNRTCHPAEDEVSRLNLGGHVLSADCPCGPTVVHVPAKDPFPMRVVTCVYCDNDAHTTREHDEADEFDPRKPHGESGLFQHEPGALCVVCDRRPGDGVWPPALRSTPAAPQPDAGLRDLIEAADTGGEVIHLAVTPTLTAALDASRPDAAAPPMVLLDVDGVVLDARGDPMPGIGFALDLLACLGFEVVLWSAGGPAYAEAAGQRTGHHGAISGYRGKPTYPPTEEEALRFVRRRPVLQVDDDPTERVADWQFMVPALRSTPAAPQPDPAYHDEWRFQRTMGRKYPGNDVAGEPIAPDQPCFDCGVPFAAHPSPADAPHRHVWVTTFGTGPDWQEHCATCPATRDVLAKEPTDD